MSKYGLESYYTTLKIVIYMAEKREREYQEELKKLDTDGDGIIEWDLSKIDIDDLPIKGKEKELFDFLNSLDYEVVKVFQVIMYIGRDSFCEEEDGTYNYTETRKYFDERGWNPDKSIEVYQMVEKVDLATYLKDGCKKLNIVL